MREEIQGSERRQQGDGKLGSGLGERLAPASGRPASRPADRAKSDTAPNPLCTSASTNCTFRRISILRRDYEVRKQQSQRDVIPSDRRQKVFKKCRRVRASIAHPV